MMTMTSDEYRAALEKLSLTQVGFALMVGASARTGQKWALGEARIPGCVILLLQLLLERPELREVIARLGKPPTRRRKTE
jgi:DNA-binding transcriptional regulator YiaG